MLNRTEQAKDGQIRSQWSMPIVEGLDARLTRFEKALSAFKWPTDPPPWFQARLVTGPAENSGGIKGEVLPSGSATPQVKLLSGGFDANAPTGIKAGTYGFTLSLGDRTESLSVTVGAKDTWGGVLGRVQNAVNYASLPARADVVYNNAAFRQNPAMVGTGSVLTLSVNPERADQNLRVADSSGTLLAQLGMYAANNPVGPASEGQYAVLGLQAARPDCFSATPVDPGAATTLALGRHDFAYAVGSGDQASTYISKAYAPGDTTTLAPGAYTFTSAYGGDKRSHSVTVKAGWTWGDVLRTVDGEINAQYEQVNSGGPTSSLSAPSSTFSQGGVNARVDQWAIPSSTTQGINTPGQSLIVTGQAGQNFTLSDGKGGLLSALGLTAKLTGAPVSFNVQAGDTWRDVYTAMGTSLGNGNGSLLSAPVSAVLPSYAVPGMALQHEGLLLALTQTDQRVGDRVTLSDGRTQALEATGVISNGQPGQDGKIIVNGTAQTSENNTFSQDQGRLLIHLQDAFGGTPSPSYAAQSDVPGLAPHQGLFLALTRADQRIGERVSLSAGSARAMHATGGISNGRPGQDGGMTADAGTRIPQDNGLSQTQNRLLSQLEDAFGSTAIPLRVTQGMDALEQGLTGVTGAYNDLAKYLHANQDVLKPGLRDSLAAPLAAQPGDLAWMGLGRTKRQGQLWTNLDTFWNSVAADPKRAQAALFDPSQGLITAWQNAVATIRAQGLDNWLAPLSSFDQNRPQLTSEFQLEQKHRLIKLMG